MHDSLVSRENGLESHVHTLEKRLPQKQTSSKIMFNPMTLYISI